MTTKDLCSLLCDKVEKSKKISRIHEDFKDCMDHVFKIIDGVNNLDEDEMRIGDVLLSNIYIPKALGDFVYPAKVSLESDHYYVDLVKRDKSKGKASVDLKKVRHCSDLLYGAYKKEAELISIADLRKKVTLHDIHYSVMGKVRLDSDNYFIPIPLIDGMIDIIGGHVLNESDDWVIGRYIESWSV